LTDKVEVRVAPAGFEGWEALRTLLTTAFAYMEGRIDPPSSLEAMSAEDLRRKARTDTLVIALHGDQPVACGFLEDRDDAVYLGKLAVLPSFRGQGLLRRIVDVAEKRARRLGKPKLELQTRVELIENHATFTALGFAITGETTHPGFDMPTSLTMTRPVAPC